MSLVPIVKDEENQQPIPTEWRDKLTELANALTTGVNLRTEHFHQMDPKGFEGSVRSIATYPDKIGPLLDRTWETSVCMWMEEYWDILVDLTTLDGEISDLVLQVRVYEVSGQFQFEPHLIYVP